MIKRCFERAGNNAATDLPVTLLMAILVFAAPQLAWAAAPATPSAQVSTATGRSYTVMRGDTLDRVIQKTLSGSPLKIELLRKAYLELNPQAFIAADMTRLRAGALLQVPDHAQLLRSTILPMLDGAEAAAASGDGRYTNANASERRSWVRFP